MHTLLLMLLPILLRLWVPATALWEQQQQGQQSSSGLAGPHRWAHLHTRLVRQQQGRSCISKHLVTSTVIAAAAQHSRGSLQGHTPALLQVWGMLAQTQQ
jgi:hypothetical protein